MKWSVPWSISVLIILGEFQYTAAWLCIKCSDCPYVTDFETTEECLGCAVWKNDNGVVERGCNDGVSINLKMPCFADKCNIDVIPACKKCSTLEDCEDVVCDNLDDKCYVSKTDERRGCTSDGIYTDSNDFVTCSSNNCNRVAQCVVCYSGNGPVDANCLDDPESFIQPCKGHGLVTEKENCYRYEVNKEQFQLGCTTDVGFPAKCDVNECKKCGPDNCNQREFQSCYVCYGCPTIEQGLSPFSCTDYDSTCVIAYDRATKQTNRECTEGLSPDEYGEIFYECSESNCNDHEFPTNRQCYQDRIQDIDFCDSLNATRCFTQQDSDGSTLIRGCDTDPGFEDCIEFVNCLICDSDGCNQDVSEIQVQCVTCTNADECRNKPQETVCDQADFFNGCYMYQGIEGMLVKGCLNGLVNEETEAYRACIENEESCRKCTGSFCNMMHCLSCNSRDGLECVAGESNVQYALCPMEDKCRMFIDDKGHTVRGCSSQFEDPICEGALCQEDEAPSSNEGLFPEGAMECYQCTEDCDAVQPEQLKYCSQNDVPGCYYKINGTNITSRGCLSEEALDCGNDPTCYECAQGKGCNFIEPWECYSCNTAGGEDCKDDDTNTCITTLNCAVYIDGNDVIRACINDLNFCDQNDGKCENTCKEKRCNNNDICAALCSGDMCNEICSSNQPEKKCVRYQNGGELQLGCIDNLAEICGADANHCSTCDENLCNAAGLAECFTCTTDCSTVDRAETKLCENREDECFTARDENGEVIRGCTSDATKDDLNDYETCSEPACNRDTIGKSCYQCEGCLELDDSSRKGCSIQNSEEFKGCYTVQDLESRTINRGCVSDSGFDSCKGDINCIICDDEDCNDHEVRSTALLCSRCSGMNCSDYTPAEQCNNSIGSLIDRCVTFSAFDVTSFKGCLSDGIPAELESDCFTTQTFCKLCDGDLCNTPDLSCFSCSTSVNGIDCIINPTQLGNEDCKNSGACVTYVEDDGHLHRGCYNNQVCIEGPLCKPCKDHDCNVHILPEERISCYQCNGDGCQESELQPTDSKPCSVYEINQSCYTYAEDKDTVHRGCSNDPSASVCDGKPCVFCHDPHCNIQKTMQPNQLSCIQCPSNSACESQAFGRNCTLDQLLGRSDQCYTLYFGDLIIEKGCLSDLPNNPDCLEENDRCQTCTGNDCNRGPALCYKCDSDEDDHCSERVSTSQYISECQAGCLTLVDVDGHTKRGCVEDFPEACENNLLCDICQGKLCNDEILPEGRQRCYVCEGSNPEYLIPIPGLIKACALYKPNDECYTRFENSTWVERGCLSSIGEETCDDECVKCPAKGCNDHRANQSNSLSCVSCEGEACSGRVDGQKCTTEILLGRLDYCYEFTDGDMVSKGCFSDLDEGSKLKEECENIQEGLCRLCSQNDCNGDIFNCVSCNSAKNPECVEPMQPTSPDMLEICAGRRCVSYVDDDGFTQKGCSNETTSCQQGVSHCYECDESMCNNAAFPEDRIACHQCEDCSDPIARPVACSKYSSNESCYTYVIGESIYRGCLSDTELECTETCLTCKSNGCNDHPYEFNSSLSCIQCSGAIDCQDKSETKLCEGTLKLGNTDQCYSLSMRGEIIQKGCQRSYPGCNEQDYCELCSCDGCNLVSDNSDDLRCIVCEGEGCGNDQIDVDHCEDKACISYVSKEGIVSRGCLKYFEQLCSSYGSKHATCYDDNCNNGLFPADRIKCHRCEDCETVLGSPEICPTYLERDACFTAISADGSTVSRGCISELKTTCIEPLCSFCPESGCNGDNQLSPTPTDPTESITTPTAGSSSTTEEGSSTTTTSSLACIRCSESNNVACAWGFQADSAEKCLTDAETGCFTCRQDDNRIVRGCSSDQGQSACSDKSIEECDDAGCNIENQRTQQCAICETNCDGPNASYQVENCDGIVEYANRGCYLIKTERRIVTKRGCVSELGAEGKSDCENSNDQCVICYNDGCNTAMTVQLLNGLIAAAIVVIVVRAKLF